MAKRIAIATIGTQGDVQPMWLWQLLFGIEDIRLYWVRPTTLEK